MSDLDGNKKLTVQLKFQHPQKTPWGGELYVSTTST